MSTIGPEYREGQTGQDRVAPYVVRPLAVSQNTTMRDLTQTGQWFTTAATLTALRVPSDPLSDFLARRPDDGVRVLLQREPFFTGLAGPSMRHWNHALFWCPTPAWPTIKAHLANCLFRDGASMISTLWYDVEVPDRLALARAVVLPQHTTVTAAVLGLSWPDAYHVCFDASATGAPAVLVRRLSNGNEDRAPPTPQL